VAGDGAVEEDGVCGVDGYAEDVVLEMGRVG